jgi:deoxyribonuclease-4
MPAGLGLVRVAERSAEIGAGTFQIFTDNPTAWRRRSHLPPDTSALLERLRELDLGPIAIHASYLVNLAGPNDEFFTRSVELLRHELALAPEYGARFVNVHVGSHRGTGLEAGVARLTDGLERALDGAASDDGVVQLVLENSCGGGDTIGSTLEELALVLDAAAARGLDRRLAICLDVAHLWGAGFDVSEPAEIDELIHRFDQLIGLDRLAMIHLNDSLSPRGSRRDHHIHLGDGQVGRRGLAHFLRHPGLARTAFYLEVPHPDRGYDAINMARLRDLLTNGPLTPGPEQAEAAAPAQGAP